MNYIDKIYTLDQIKESTHTYSEDPRLELNLYLPPEVKENFPVVIWMPAGGATKDDVQCVNWAKNEFACRGYAGITANVKETVGDFTPDKQYKAVSNTMAVIRWVRAHKEEFNLSGKKIFLGGNSAGSLSAVQTAISAVYIKEVTHAGKEGPLDAEDYEAFFGKVDYNKSNMGERIAVFGSAIISGAAGEFDKFIVEESDPNYGYIGDQDELFYKGALKTQDAYRLKNVPSTMTVYAGKGHNIGEQDAIIADLIPKFAALVTKDADNPTL